jgi:hypothetical protein
MTIIDGERQAVELLDIRVVYEKRTYSTVFNGG